MNTRYQDYKKLNDESCLSKDEISFAKWPCDEKSSRSDNCENIHVPKKRFLKENVLMCAEVTEFEFVEIEVET